MFAAFPPAQARKSSMLPMLGADAQTRPADVEAALACPQSGAAVHAVLACVQSPAHARTVRKALAEQRRGEERESGGDGAHAQRLEQRNRLITELVARRTELAACADHIRARQGAVEEHANKREELTRSCDLARRQLVHLQAYRCKLRRAARVIRGSASQLQLHAMHKWPDEASSEHSASAAPDSPAVRGSLRQHLAQLVQRTFTAEGALVDESIRFLRGNGVTMQQLTKTLVFMLGEAGEQLNTGSLVEQSPQKRNDGGCEASADDAATLKMRALLTLAHGQHISAFEEVETLRADAHEARARAEELAAEVEKKLSQAAMSDSEWRITSISMKQDRDLAAARASVGVVQSRLNDMKVKAQLEKQVSDRLNSLRGQLRAVERDIRQSRGRASALETDIRRLVNLIYERNIDIANVCEAEIASGGPEVKEAAENSRVALAQHALHKSFAALPAVGHLRSSKSPWETVAGALARALGAPCAADCVLLQRVATESRRIQGVSARITYGQARREAMIARAADSSWKNEASLAKMRALLDSWDTRWKRVVEDELRVAVRTGMDAVERATKLENLVIDCLEHPAQFAAPWLKVEGKTMHEWSLYLRGKHVA